MGAGAELFQKSLCNRIATHFTAESLKMLKALNRRANAERATIARFGKRVSRNNGARHDLRGCRCAQNDGNGAVHPVYPCLTAT
jgi:hypothetical protein